MRARSLDGGPVIDRASLETALRAALPEGQQDTAPVLARLVSKVAAGELKAEEAQAQIVADEGLKAALRALSGHEVEAGNKVVSFEGAQTGDVKIDAVAGRDVIKITVNVYNQPPALVQPSTPSNGAQPAPKTNASCFISYSTVDEAFAQQLADRLRQAEVGVWFAPDDVRGGAKLYDQIQQAIRGQDKLILVLSESSMASNWVATEIRLARRVEREQGAQKLFPIRLVDMQTLRAWELFDADTGSDLAVEVREYFVPDFSRWQDEEAFERAVARLLRDLQVGL